MPILAVHVLAVNDLAVNGALPLYVESKSVLYTQYSVKKCLVHFMKRLTIPKAQPRRCSQVLLVPRAGADAVPALLRMVRRGAQAERDGPEVCYARCARHF